MKPKSLLVALLGLVCVVWLLNPPGLNIDDMAPFVGNLDEAAAALILINCLAYFGLDLTRFFKDSEKPAPTPTAERRAVVDVESEVVRPVR